MIIRKILSDTTLHRILLAEWYSLSTPRIWKEKMYDKKPFGKVFINRIIKILTELYPKYKYIQQEYKIFDTRDEFIFYLFS